MTVHKFESPLKKLVRLRQDITLPNSRLKEINIVHALEKVIDQMADLIVEKEEFAPPSFYKEGIVQIAYGENRIVALCENNSIWCYDFAADRDWWYVLPPVPLRGKEEI